MSKQVEVKIIVPFGENMKKGDTFHMKESDAIKYQEEGLVKIIDNLEDKRSKKVEVKILIPIIESQKKGDIRQMKKEDAIKYQEEGLVKILDKPKMKKNISAVPPASPSPVLLENNCSSLLYYDLIFNQNLNFDSIFNEYADNLFKEVQDYKNNVKFLTSITLKKDYKNKIEELEREFLYNKEIYNKLSDLNQIEKYNFNIKIILLNYKRYSYNLTFTNENIFDKLRKEILESRIKKLNLKEEQKRQKYFLEEKAKEEKAKEEVINYRNKEILSKIIEGDFTLFNKLKTTSTPNINLFENEILLIQFDTITKVFNLYVKKTKKVSDGMGGFYEEIINVYFGSFIKLKRYVKEVYEVNVKLRYKKVKVLEIKNVSNDEEKDTKTINLNEPKFVELGRHIKVGTGKDQDLYLAYKCFFQWVRDSQDLNTHELKVTNCYGIFSKDVSLMPNNSRLNINSLLKEEDLNTDIELSEFENTFDNELRQEYTEEEKEKVTKSFLNYLKKSYRARVTTTYSLMSLFRQLLMREYKLKAFNFLALISNKSNTGKSTIIRICCNNLLTGFDSPGYGADLLKGTTQRITGFGFISTPLTIDDLKEINNNSTIDLLKTSATSPCGHTTKYPNNTKTTYFNLRPILASVNRFSISDPNLADRFIMVNYDNPNIQELEFVVEETEINFILDHIFILRYILFDNLESFVKMFESLEFKTDRENSNNTIFNLGNKVLNHFFSLLGIENAFSTELNLLFDNSRDSILTSEDLFKRNIEEELERLTTIDFKDNSTSQDGDNYILNTSFQKYNFRTLLNKDFRDDILESAIIEQAKKNNIKLVLEEDKLKIGVSKLCIDSMRLKDFKLNSLNDLSLYFKAEDETKNIRIEGKQTKTKFIIFERSGLEEEEKEEKAKENEANNTFDIEKLKEDVLFDDE